MQVRKIWFAILALVIFATSTQVAQAGGVNYSASGNSYALPVLPGYFAAPVLSQTTATNLLGWGNLLADNTTAATSVYTSNDDIQWQGVNGATQYKAFTDCSGLVTALITQTYGTTNNQLISWFGTKGPRAAHYYSKTVETDGFTRITDMNNVQRGDIIAIRYTNVPFTNTSQASGHVAIVAEVPTQTTAFNPIIAGTTQWTVRILDSSSSGHGRTDTRYITATNTYRGGVGRGNMRIYTNSTTGQIVGYTWSDVSGSTYFDLTVSSSNKALAIGRLVATNN